METDKVFEASFTFTETARGLFIGKSVEQVSANIITKYGNFPDFKLLGVKEVIIKEDTAEDSDTPPITIN